MDDLEPCVFCSSKRTENLKVRIWNGVYNYRRCSVCGASVHVSSPQEDADKNWNSAMYQLNELTGKHVK